MAYGPAASPTTRALARRAGEQARAELDKEIFGKHALTTSHDHWPAAEIITGDRSQAAAKFPFRQMKDPHDVSFSPMHHCTDHSIRVHVFTRALAPQIAHLRRHRAHSSGPDLSARELQAQLAAIGETALIHPPTGGRPQTRRMTTELTGNQPHLGQILGPARWAPKSQAKRENKPPHIPDQPEPSPRTKIIGNSG